MIRAGISEKVAMQISDHKTRSILDRYNIMSERDLAKAATKMEQRFQNSTAYFGADQPNPQTRIPPLIFSTD